MPTIHLSEALSRTIEGKHAVFSNDATTLTEALSSLVSEQPTLKPYLYASHEQFNPFISIYLNGQDIRFLNNHALPLSAEDKIEIIASLAGG